MTQCSCCGFASGHHEMCLFGKPAAPPKRDIKSVRAKTLNAMIEWREFWKDQGHKVKVIEDHDVYVILHWREDAP